MWPKPLWFIDNKAGATVGRKMTYFNADPSLMRLPGILWAALFG
jgi:aldehyde dehydrogenase (NAD(P)+)